jgi:hypothetical protein
VATHPYAHQQEILPKLCYSVGDGSSDESSRASHDVPDGPRCPRIGSTETEDNAEAVTKEG